MWHDLDQLLLTAPGAWSVCVWGAAGRQRYGLNEHAVRSAASLIKVPLAIAVLDALVAQAAFALDTPVVLREADRVDGTGSVDTAPAGTIKTVRELIGHALRESDNTASNLLIDLVGMERVNGWLASHGLRTRMRRKFMDFDALAAGRDNTTSASDMCAIMQHVLQHERYATLLHDLQRSVGDGKLEAALPPDVPLAHKVGDLPSVEHDAGIVFAPNGAYIIAVLGVDLPDVKAGRRMIADVSRVVWEELQLTN
jgi:beta-lactamase class A